ncbi:hypothetical protein T05_10268 [Trichinella murrelli]|uniref:Uncharacterized protein n=1 Tax=Trichinella murrelli TaxID=144512 RepID=A0A0V0TNS1_9BILA|nr:hypothetical protein T05_5200 [Trichinella murrelli]KRX40215.1 hypothetical protein T05_10268 [Trichinella murrelli]
MPQNRMSCLVKSCAVEPYFTSRKNVHITASPFSRNSVMVFRKQLSRYFTAVKLRSALVEAIV